MSLPNLNELQSGPVVPKPLQSFIPVSVHNETVDIHKPKILKTMGEKVDYVINEVGFLKAVGNYSKNMWIDRLQEDPAKYLSQYACAKDLIEYIETENELGPSSKYVFIVVNPSPEAQLNLPKLIELASKAMSKVFIEHYIMSFEQRGVLDSPEFGTGIHMNFLIVKNEQNMKKKPKRIADEIYNTFKNVCGNRMHVVHRYAANPENFLNYILGEKSDPSKLDLIFGDIEWRKSVGLAGYYTDDYSYWGTFLNQE